MPDQQGNSWAGSNDGLIKWQNGRVVRRITARDGLPEGRTQVVYGSLPVQVLTFGKDNSLWLTDAASLKSQRITPQLPEGFDIRAVYGDREGNIWLGSFRNGLYRIRKQAVTAYAKPQGLKTEEVYPILEDRTGAVWIGSAGDGLFRCKDGEFTQYNRVPYPAWNSITSLFEDHARQLLVNGKWRFEAGRLVQRISDEVYPPLALRICWTMYEDQDGAIWFGTEGGVLRYQNGKRTLFTTKDGLAGDDTKVIIPDSRGGLWLGSHGGLTHFKDGRFIAYTERDGLPGNTVRALQQDSDGTLWIGTYDSGLGRFKDGKFTRYTTREGLFDNGVFQMLEDDFGWVWMSCNRGIYRVRKQELTDFAEGKIKAITSIAYGKSDGMLSAECNGGRWPAGIKAHNGRLWFPTMGGVAVIDPATVKANTQPPPVIIEEMRIDNQAVAVELTDSALRTPHSALQIGPQQSNFEIQYTALSFLNSENIHFKYKVEGLDQDWVDAGTRRTAYFSHVAPGNYTFKVIAANSDGIWNLEGQSLRLSVKPPFYRTWWFLTLAALAVGGAVFGIFKYRVTQLEQRQAAQQVFARQLIESQEAERKRLAAELHDSLGQHLLVIKNRAALGEQVTTDATPA